jgi:DNA invertase Pin-like site-specific DNA recombinase
MSGSWYGFDSMAWFFVSLTLEPNPQLQLDALHEAEATRVFTDHGVSGATACRPELDACLDHLREGDGLTVWKLDRLGRNTQHVLAMSTS